MNRRKMRCKSQADSPAKAHIALERESVRKEVVVLHPVVVEYADVHAESVYKATE